MTAGGGGGWGWRDGAKRKKDSWTWATVIAGGGVLRGLNGNRKIQ